MKHTVYDDRHNERKFMVLINATIDTLHETCAQAGLCHSCVFRSVIASLIATVASNEALTPRELQELMEQLNDQVVTNMMRPTI